MGFLILNFHPAKIFLGESGSLFIGFILGILAIISGGKIATALLVMAIPVLDLIRVMYLRIRHHQPIFRGDRMHLHFRLRDAGFSERVTVLFLYAVSFIFGLTTLFLPSKAKLIVLVFLSLAMFLVGFFFKEDKRVNKNSL
jgi:UDP-GlcNAc:undecaprenyl-phosphate GlcNAc-1-phosphate transferase